MFNYFDLDIIPTFLSRFKVDKILAIGLSNEFIMKEVISFCVENESLLYAIDPKINIKDLVEKNFKLENIDDYANKNIKYFNDYGLNILPSLKSFDAIFINDDPNWYTVFTELNLIKKNNPNFPLVFICNNKYPHKRRDSYINPECIPKEYKQECCNELPIEYEENNEIKKTMVKDGFCHAVDKDTPNNGVLTAIEDFLKENDSLNILEINPLEGVSLIYFNSNISYIRINQILENEIESKYAPGDLSDKIIENNLLLKHIAKTNMLKSDIDKIEEFKLEIDEKNSQIKNYEDELELHNFQMNYKDSQINNAKSQINLKETQLQSIEAKLFNKNHEIKSKEEELEFTKSKLSDLENIISNNEKELKNTKKQLSVVKSNSKNHELAEKKYKELIEIKNKELGINNKLSENKIALLKSHYLKQFSKLNEKEYCINCYKEKIDNNNAEIEYLKRSNKLGKKLINPLAYILIITKSKLREIGVNIKLYKTLKNSNCFDIGYYLKKYPDIPKSNWCKYFSPELHYVCKGFDENRKFNKKYYNNNKKQLIERIERE